MEGIYYHIYANHLQWGTLVVLLKKAYLFLTILLTYQKSNQFNPKNVKASKDFNCDILTF